MAAALKLAPREVRCLLWLVSLHLLVMGVFPAHALVLADGTCDSTSASASRRPDLLHWPRDWLSPESDAGVRLSASDELRDATTKTFMCALQDVGLLPAEDGSGGGWAPPLRVRDALLPGAIEAKAARAGGMAPDPSALEGPSLAIALNWLTFCSRGGRGLQGVHTVALACCRRFQLSRPDHPAMLEHLLLEHDVSKSRSLADVYHEISLAFDGNGAAAAAARERGEDTATATDNDTDTDTAIAEGGADRGGSSGGSGVKHAPHDTAMHPSGRRLQAVYAFLRFAEGRMQVTAAKALGDDAPPGAQEGGGDGAAAAAAAEEAGREMEATQSVLREALVGLWTTAEAPPPVSDTLQAKSASPDRRSREEGGESLRRAVEGAKASLFLWADGTAAAARGGVPVAGAGCRTSDEDDALGAERQLSTIFFTLWVLAGPLEATGALDHLLSAESFSAVSPERRRIAWLQRLEAAVVLSDQQVCVV